MNFKKIKRIWIIKWTENYLEEKLLLDSSSKEIEYIKNTKKSLKKILYLRDFSDCLKIILFNSIRKIIRVWKNWLQNKND